MIKKTTGGVLKKRVICAELSFENSFLIVHL